MNYLTGISGRRRVGGTIPPTYTEFFEDDLVAAYKFNGVSDAEKMADVLGANDWDSVVGSVLSANDRLGTPNRAAYFNGTSLYYRITDPTKMANLRLPGSQTICGWVKFPATLGTSIHTVYTSSYYADDKGIFFAGYRLDSTSGYRMYMKCNLGTGLRSAVVPDYNISNDTWTFIALAINAHAGGKTYEISAGGIGEATLSTYDNSNLVLSNIDMTTNTNPFSYRLDANARTLMNMYFYNSVYYHSGYMNISNFRIYDRYCTPSELAVLFNAEKTQEWY